MFSQSCLHVPAPQSSSLQTDRSSFTLLSQSSTFPLPWPLSSKPPCPKRCYVRTLRQIILSCLYL